MVVRGTRRSYQRHNVGLSFHPFRGDPMAKFFVNGEQVDFRGPPETPLLWALRDNLGLTGTKFGCGMSLCGACTVHLDGEPTRACVTPVSTIEGKRVVTIEGIDKTSQARVATA